MSSTPIPVLIVGTGFGCRIQVPAFNGAGFRVVGLLGTDAKRTAERAEANGVGSSFTDFDRALSETGAQVVAISTPPYTHGDLVVNALTRGCHVLCEKPFARDAAEAHRMQTAAQRAGKVCLLGNEFRFDPRNAAVARAIADGLIGEPRFASLVQYSGYVANFESDIPEWWFDPARGGGWLGASGSHQIDLIRTWLGEFESLSASLTTVTASRGPVDDSFSARFRLQSGVEGVLQQSAGAHGPFAQLIRIAGSDGTIWTDGRLIHHADRSGERVLPVPADLVLPKPPLLTGDPRHSRVEWQMMAAVEIAPYTQLCRVMRAAILSEDSPSSIRPADFGDGVMNMAVLDAIRRSAAQGGATMTVTGSPGAS